MTNSTKYFERVALNYRHKTQSFIWRWVRKSESEKVMSFLPDLKGGDVLELGVGAGYYASIINEYRPNSLTCVDISENMLAQIDIENCQKIVADVETFCGDSQYDVILAAGVIEFLSDPTALFANSSKMLRDHGSFIILYPHFSIFGLLYKGFHWKHGVACKLFFDSEIISVAQSYGFRLVKQMKGGLFSTIVKLEKYEEC